MSGRGGDGHRGGSRGKRLSHGSARRRSQRDGPGMRHTLSILVENHYGELARIVGLFSARGYNIESLTVAETLDKGISCVTLVTSGDDRAIEQIVKQLDKLVRVLHVSDLNGSSHFQRELVLINVKTENHAALQTVLALVAADHLRVAEVMEDGLIIEATGDW